MDLFGFRKRERVIKISNSPAVNKKGWYKQKANVISSQVEKTVNTFINLSDPSP